MDADGWMRFVDSQGRAYLYNPTTCASRWVDDGMPASAKKPLAPPSTSTMTTAVNTPIHNGASSTTTISLAAAMLNSMPKTNDTSTVIDSSIHVLDRRGKSFGTVLRGLLDVSSGRTYEYNTETGVSEWGGSTANDEKDDKKEAARWIRVKDNRGREYEYDLVSCKSRWLAPPPSAPSAKRREAKLYKASERTSRRYRLTDPRTGLSFLYDRDTNISTPESKATEEMLFGAVDAVEETDYDEEATASDMDADEMRAETETEPEDGVGESVQFNSSYLLEGLLAVRTIHESEKLFEMWPTFETFEEAFRSPHKHWELLMTIHQVVLLEEHEFRKWKQSLTRMNPRHARMRWLRSLYTTIGEWKSRPSAFLRQHASYLESLWRFVQPSGSSESCPYKLSSSDTTDQRPLYVQLSPETRTRIFLALCSWGLEKSAHFLKSGLTAESASVSRAVVLGMDGEGHILYWFKSIAPYRIFREKNGVLVSISSDAQTLAKAIFKLLAMPELPRNVAFGLKQIHREIIPLIPISFPAEVYSAHLAGTKPAQQQQAASTVSQPASSFGAPVPSSQHPAEAVTAPTSGSGVVQQQALTQAQHQAMALAQQLATTQAQQQAMALAQQQQQALAYAQHQQALAIAQQHAYAGQQPPVGLQHAMTAADLQRMYTEMQRQQWRQEAYQQQREFVTAHQQQAQLRPLEHQQRQQPGSVGWEQVGTFVPVALTTVPPTSTPKAVVHQPEPRPLQGPATTMANNTIHPYPSRAVELPQVMAFEQSAPVSDIPPALPPTSNLGLGGDDVTDAASLQKEPLLREVSLRDSNVSPLVQPLGLLPHLSEEALAHVFDDSPRPILHAREHENDPFAFGGSLAATTTAMSDGGVPIMPVKLPVDFANSEEVRKDEGGGSAMADSDSVMNTVLRAMGEMDNGGSLNKENAETGVVKNAEITGVDAAKREGIETDARSAEPQNVKSQDGGATTASEDKSKGLGVGPENSLSSNELKRDHEAQAAGAADEADAKVDEVDAVGEEVKTPVKEAGSTGEEDADAAVIGSSASSLPSPAQPPSPASSSLDNNGAPSSSLPRHLPQQASEEQETPKKTASPPMMTILSNAPVVLDLAPRLTSQPANLTSWRTAAAPPQSTANVDGKAKNGASSSSVTAQLASLLEVGSGGMASSPSTTMKKKPFPRSPFSAAVASSFKMPSPNALPALKALAQELRDGGSDSSSSSDVEQERKRVKLDAPMTQRPDDEEDVEDDDDDDVESSPAKRAFPATQRPETVSSSSGEEEEKVETTNHTHSIPGKMRRLPGPMTQRPDDDEEEDDDEDGNEDEKEAHQPSPRAVGTTLPAVPLFNGL